MTTTVKKDPRVNGSWNKDLTMEELLAFDKATKKDVAWSIIVGLGYAHSFRDIAHDVFMLMPQKYTCDMIDDDNVDAVLTDVFKAYHDRYRQLLFLTKDHYFRIGQEIRKQQQKLGFGGEITMDYRKLIGYIHAIGSWNDFNCIDVAKAVDNLETLTPKFYSENNPNNGMKEHEWIIKGDYIMLHWKYVSERWDNNVNEKTIMRFYRDYWQPTARSIKADSVRFEKQEVSEDACTLTLIYWWD